MSWTLGGRAHRRGRDQRDLRVKAGALLAAAMLPLPSCRHVLS
jgi:hypothetical protein